ncbi:metal ABC transporter substrate-binding protein [Priestia flexa]|uniref:metal ABC transporter substrate-binding protein n=1 Tax=Priestia flexa TaxID=86664 RepID=UPI002E2135F8|nr:metal ABC transporter substrate-binding protein [Priestia flexa]
MKVKATFMALALGTAAFLAGCGADNSDEQASSKDDKLTVYTTIFPLQDFTKKIGGDEVNVESVLPPGVDAHSYEPTTKDMVEIAKGDAFIYSGIGLEGFADKAQDTLKNEDVAMVEAAKGIELAESTHSDEDEHAHGHGDTDPHIWLDPVLSIQLAENIKNELIELKPEAKEEFEKNYEDLKAQLEELDQKLETTISEGKHKEILVSHAAYGYWEKRYGLTQISVAGLSPTNEPSQKQLQSIIKEANEHNIKYFIFDQNLEPKVSKLVQKEVGAEALTLHNLESATKDDVANKEDYFSIMDKNIETIQKALN